MASAGRSAMMVPWATGPSESSSRGTLGSRCCLLTDGATSVLRSVFLPGSLPTHASVFSRPIRWQAGSACRTLSLPARWAAGRRMQSSMDWATSPTPTWSIAGCTIYGGIPLSTSQARTSWRWTGLTTTVPPLFRAPLSTTCTRTHSPDAGWGTAGTTPMAAIFTAGTSMAGTC